MQDFLEQAAELIKEGTPFVYVTILSGKGSTPRGAGSKMLVLEDKIYGTIGGGGMEYRVVTHARDVVLKDKSTLVEEWDLSADNAADSTFICGGKLELLISYIDPSDKNALEVFEAAAQAAFKGEEAVIFYVIDQRPEAVHPLQIVLNLHGNTLIGEFEQVGVISRKLLESTLRTSLHGGDEEGVLVVPERVSSQGVMYLFGAGHVSQEVAFQAVHLGFRVIVIDDREDFANIDRFPDCEFVIAEDFEKEVPDFEINDNSYILIITRGHKNDRTVLEWALSKDPFYLGMIGSVSKRKISYDRLIENGIDPKKLETVHSPIGLEIGAETPAEIAIAILGEIIKLRRESLK